MKGKRWIADALPGVILLMLLICFPAEMTEGIRDGMILCGTAVIPSLFPMFVLCGFFTRSGLCDACGKVTDPFMRRVFRLPGTAFGAWILGMCGGYPVGIRMTTELFRKGSLSRRDAGRMCLFCIAAGPAFLTGTVGASMLGSRISGWILFAAVTLSNLTIALFLRQTATPCEVRTVPIQKTPALQSFCEAISASGMGMIPMCAWVLLFSGICAVAKGLAPSVAVPLCCVLEVTNGCRMAAENGLVLPIIAAVVGFGGLSVHCQVMGDVLDCGVKPSTFWAFRVLSGGLAAVYCKAILRIFPQAAMASAVVGKKIIAPTTASVPSSIALVFTAAVFILNTAEGFENCRRGLHPGRQR